LIGERRFLKKELDMVDRNGGTETTTSENCSGRRPQANGIT
jgi:hypothetical protein